MILKTSTIHSSGFSYYAMTYVQYCLLKFLYSKNLIHSRVIPYPVIRKLKNLIVLLTLLSELLFHNHSIHVKRLSHVALYQNSIKPADTGLK